MERASRVLLLIALQQSWGVSVQQALFMNSGVLDDAGLAVVGQ